MGTVPEAQGARERKSGRGGPRTASAASQRPAKTSARLRLPQPQPRSGPRPTTTPRVASPSGALPPLPPAPTRPALTQGRRSGPGLRVTYVDVLRHRGGRGRTRSANPPQRLATPLRPCGEEGAGGGWPCGEEEGAPGEIRCSRVAGARVRRIRGLLQLLSIEQGSLSTGKTEALGRRAPAARLPHPVL